MTIQQDPNSRKVPYVMSASIRGVIFAITKLNSHCVISAAAIMSERTWFGAHSEERTKGMGPQPNE